VEYEIIGGESRRSSGRFLRTEADPVQELKKMKTRLVTLVATAILSGAVWAAPVAGVKSKESDDARLIQGKWTIVSLDDGVMKKGNWLKEKALGLVLVVRGDRVAPKSSLKEGKEFELEEGAKALKIKLDPSRSPKEIDIKIGELPDALGIYELDKDTLKLCMANHKDVPRPTKFETKPGSEWLLVVLKRSMILLSFTS
jgi:uncharacterized protein (TIGR03067 family)